MVSSLFVAGPSQQRTGHGWGRHKAGGVARGCHGEALWSLCIFGSNRADSGDSADMGPDFAGES